VCYLPNNKFGRRRNSFDGSYFFYKHELILGEQAFIAFVRRSQGLFWVYRSGKLTTLIGKKIADGRALGLIQQMLTASGQKFPTPGAIPQRGIISHLLSNIPLSRKTSNKWSWDRANFVPPARALRYWMSTPTVARFAGD
jgi:hypothetical protein